MLKLQSLKQKNGKEWQQIPVASFAGQTFAAFFEAMEGKEVVSEILFSGHLIYLCGTPAWVTRMKDKGHKACSFQEALETLQKSGTPYLLDGYVAEPEYDTQIDIFGGDK